MVVQRRMYVPLEVLQTPITGECLVDRYWMVHPEKGALYTLNEHEAYYQGSVRETCNADKRIVERFLLPEHEVAQVHVAYLAHGTRMAETFRAQVREEIARRRAK